MKKLVLLLIPAAVFFGCGKQGVPGAKEIPPVPSAPGQYAEKDRAEGGAMDTKASEAEASPSGTMTAQTQAGEATGALKLPERMVAYTAYFTMLTRKFQETMDRVSAMPEKYGGYMVSSNVYKTGENQSWYAQVVFKVPSDRLQEVEAELKGLPDVEVETYSKTSQDVTEEYLDLQVRLANKKSLAERMRQLLARTVGVSDALQVEYQLERFTEEIEIMEGRMKYLENITSYSQVEVVIHEPYPTPLGSEGGPIEILKKSIQFATTFFFFVIAGLIIVVGGVLPLVIIGLILWLIIWAIVKSRRNKRKKQTA